MGNYQEHLKRINPLREVDSGSVRTQLFGNPYKLERPTDNKVMVITLLNIILLLQYVTIQCKQWCSQGMAEYGSHHTNLSNLVS